MGALSIKGVRFDEGRPKTIVSLMGTSEDALVAEGLRAVAAGADLVEWRADFFDELHNPEAAVYTARSLAKAFPNTPLIFTVRTRGQGGHVELDASSYTSLLQDVLGSGRIDIVDIEKTAGEENVRALVDAARVAGTHTIISHHDFEGTPSTEWMVGTLMRMAELGASIAKLAVMAHSPTDCLRLMEATATAREQLVTPLITMAMGADGVLSRLAGETSGSMATFCALGNASAPGQVELAEAMKLLDGLHAVSSRERNTGGDA